MSESHTAGSNTYARSPSDTFAEIVYQRLREEIMSGVLQPGDRLREVEVAKWMHTSQGPVREAFARLREQGFIFSLPYRGSFVTDIPAEEARDAYTLRELLEPWAMQRALPRMGPSEFAELEDDIAAMERAVKEGSIENLVYHDMRFHRRIFEWSGSETGLQLWDIVSLKIRKFAIVATWPVFNDHPASIIRSHYSLLKRMREGYSSELEKELDRHSSRIRKAL